MEKDKELKMEIFGALNSGYDNVVILQKLLIIIETDRKEQMKKVVKELKNLSKRQDMEFSKSYQMGFGDCLEEIKAKWRNYERR